MVQVGTSEEILTEPANDYVARFVENVDRSKIITAGSIMITRPAVARLRKEGPEVLIRKMKERDITVLPVIDENDKLIGPSPNTWWPLHYSMWCNGPVLR